MNMHKPSWVVGIDVGGTFTDLIMLSADDAAVRLAKVPTTMHNQAYGVVAALKAAGAILADLQVIVHGTTTTTNAILERKVAKAGLITTGGFRDSLELGRRTRPKPYGLTGSLAPPGPREVRLERPPAQSRMGSPARSSRWYRANCVSKSPSAWTQRAKWWCRSTRRQWVPRCRS